MKKLTVKKLVTPVLIATLAVGCAELQKPQSFLDAEEAYQIVESSTDRYELSEHKKNRTFTI